MALISPFANLFNELLNKLKTVTQLRFIAQDLGQLEHYNIRPAVTYPCCLIDIDEMSFSDMQNDKTQMGEGFIQVRIGMVKYTDANNLTPDVYLENALQYYEIEQAVHLALHGWAPPLDGFGRMLRRNAVTEKRDDDIRVRLLRYAINFTDVSTKPVRTTIPRPDTIIGDKK